MDDDRNKMERMDKKEMVLLVSKNFLGKKRNCAISV
jgi:hypothetical protein